LVIILFMMQASKKIPFEEDWCLQLVRGLYIVSNVAILGLYLYVKTQIDKKKGKQDHGPDTSHMTNLGLQT